jgi:hypothetical protein
MQKLSYDGYRFPPEIIQQAIWLYLRFALSFRDVEDLLAERGIAVSYETVRRWVNHFGPASTPEAISDELGKAPSCRRVVFETGRMAPMLYHSLNQRGLPVVCVESQQA